MIFIKYYSTFLLYNLRTYLGYLIIILSQLLNIIYIKLLIFYHKLFIL